MQQDRICFVACVESGPLEAQTVRLAESIRRFGGSMSDSEIIAVTPRFGPPLTRATHRRFEALGVRHERSRSHPDYAWYHYLNTPLALAAADELTDAELLAWVDSDILFLAEPTEFRLAPDVEFTAGVTDNGVVGSTGPDSPHDPDWRRLCDLLGIDLDELPWVRTELEGQLVRLYFQAGVFIYRRGLGFSKHYLDTCTKALDARFGFAHNAEHFTDQVCLGLSMFSAGLRWKQLPYDHNFPVASFLPPSDSPRPLAEARILHYHDSMEASQWPGLLAGLEESHPEAHAWLATERPLGDPAPPVWRFLREGLRVVRGLPRRRYRLQMRPA
jgi:hypothetical protein